MARAVRKDSLSLILFNLLIVDLEEKIKRVKQGKILLEEKRVFTIAYIRHSVEGEKGRQNKEHGEKVEAPR